MGFSHLINNFLLWPEPACVIKRRCTRARVEHLKRTLPPPNTTSDTPLCHYLKQMTCEMLAIGGIVLGTRSIVLKGLLKLMDVKWFTHDMPGYKKGTFVWPPCTCPCGLCNYEITWSARRGVEVGTAETCTGPLQRAPSFLQSFINLWEIKPRPFLFQRNLSWRKKWFKTSLPVYRKESQKKNKLNIMLCIPNIVLLTWYVPTSPYFSPFSSFCWKSDQQDVYFPLSPALFKIEPTFVSLILLVFETVKATGNHTLTRLDLIGIFTLHRCSPDNICTCTDIQ